MAKKSKAELKSIAVVKAALTRALAVVEAQAKKLGATELDEGSYPVAMDVSIAGDVTVGKSTPPGEPRECSTVADGEVLYGMLATMTKTEIRAAVRKAFKLHLRAGTSEKAKADLDQGKKHLTEVLLDEAKKLGLVRTVTPSGRRGSVAGKPHVQVTGSAGEHKLELEVADA